MNKENNNYQISIVDKFGVVLYRYCGDWFKIEYQKLINIEYDVFEDTPNIELPILIDDITKVFIYCANYNLDDVKIALTKYLKLLLCTSGNRIEIIISNGEVSSLYCIDDLNELEIFSSTQYDYIAYYMRIYFDKMMHTN